MSRMTPKELYELACHTRDPRALKPEILQQMKEAQVGPFSPGVVKLEELFNEPR